MLDANIHCNIYPSKANCGDSGRCLYVLYFNQSNNRLFDVPLSNFVVAVTTATVMHPFCNCQFNIKIHDSGQERQKRVSYNILFVIYVFAVILIYCYCYDFVQWYCSPVLYTKILKCILSFLMRINVMT